MLARALPLAGLLLWLATSPAHAHVTAAAGLYRVTMGWGTEPARSGSPNFVDVAVATRAGAPVRVAPGALEVEAQFGAAVTTLPLVPATAPGRLRAAIVPTLPGTYSFHVSGTVAGHVVEARSTCSARTFDCVSDAAEIEFPVKDPSRAELARKLDRVVARAERASDDASGARMLALVALIVAVVAAALLLLLRMRRKGG